MASRAVSVCFLLSLTLPAFSARAATPQAAVPAGAGQTRGEQRGTENPLTERQRQEIRADLFMARKQYSEAVEAYKEMLAQEPRNPALLNRTGIAYHQMMNLDQARRYYERAIKADKTFASAINNLGTIHYSRKKYRQAAKQYQRALEINPTVPSFHTNLGYAFFAQKKYEEAMACFQSALLLDPEVLDRRAPSGSVLQDQSVTDKAFFYFFLAKSFAQQGNAERCAHFLRKARDEGYKGIQGAKTDPAFASVVNDPQVQAVLQPPPTAAAAPRPEL